MNAKKMHAKDLVDTFGHVKIALKELEPDERLLKEELKRRFEHRKGNIMKGDIFQVKYYWSSKPYFDVESLREEMGDEFVEKYMKVTEFPCVRSDLIVQDNVVTNA